MSYRAEDEQRDGQQDALRAAVGSEYELTRCADALERIAAALERSYPVVEPHGYQGVATRCAYCERIAEDPIHKASNE